MTSLSKSLPQTNVKSKPPKLTARDLKSIDDLVKVHGVKHSSQIYTEDSMTGYSWTCRVNFGYGYSSGYLFAVTRPIDEEKTDEARERFYAKVILFKETLDKALTAFASASASNDGEVRDGR